MFISVLTSITYEEDDTNLRVFEVEFTSSKISQYKVILYKIKGIKDQNQKDIYIDPFVGQPFICSVYRKGKHVSLNISPNYQEEIELICSNIFEEVVSPFDKDWEYLAKVTMINYAKEYEHAGVYLGLYNQVKDKLESEIEKELNSNNKKLDYFRGKNQGKWERLKGRNEGLLLILEGLQKITLKK